MPAEIDPIDQNAVYTHHWGGTSGFIFGDSVFESMRVAASRFGALKGRAQHLFYIDSWYGSSTGIVDLDNVRQRNAYLKRPPSFCPVCAEIGHTKLKDVVERTKPAFLIAPRESLLPGQIPLEDKVVKAHTWLKAQRQLPPMSTTPTSLAALAADIHMHTSFQAARFESAYRSINEVLKAEFKGTDRVLRTEEIIEAHKGHDGSYKKVKDAARKLA